MNSYESMILFSANKYIEQLKGFSPQLSKEGQQLTKSLILSLHAAIEKRENLSPQDISFNRQSIDEIQLDEREHFINQYSMGLGASSAPIIFVGTEHAYNLSNTLPLTLEAIGLTILWLCNGKREIFSKLSGIQNDIGAPFHIHPNALYKVQKTTKGQHTWKVISSILSIAEKFPIHDRLLTGYNPGLGDVAFQVEMSAFPSKRTVGGRFPTKERLLFLENLIVSMRSTAKTIVFHGKLNIKEWHSKQVYLAKRFLDIPQTEKRTYTSRKVDGQELRFAMTESHKAIFTRALSWEVSNEYREAVAELIRG